MKLCVEAVLSTDNYKVLSNCLPAKAFVNMSGSLHAKWKENISL